MGVINNRFEYAPRVKEALLNDDPVVALESSIISHGMPYPQNIEVAALAEQAVRNNGAVPATLGVYKGKIIVGMDEEQIRSISNNSDDPSSTAMKASVKGIPFAVAQKRNAGFTIAAILRTASMAGIRFMATGGIGGVSRGGENTMDVSADLNEFGRTSVAVICSGCKSILDISRTKEVLETRDVPVIGIGVDSFPAFFTRTSSTRIDYRIDNYGEVADFLKSKWDLGFEGAVILCNPVLKEFEMPEEEITSAIEKAVLMAKEQHIGGEHNTPFLLSQVKSITGGKSLKTNIEIVRNNAKVAALIANEYFKPD
jgi:pseudouridine-5'-phosphate glycosidase